MTKLLHAVLASLLLAAAPASADPTTRVTNRVDTFRNSRTFKGAVVAIVKDGYTYWYNYGWRDNSNGISVTTPVAVASITKTFVGAELVMEDQTGIDELTTLGSLTPIFPGSPTISVTLRDLASMMGGLKRDLSWWPTTRDQLLSTLSDCFGNTDCTQPKPTYSNWGYQILGNILAMEEGFATWTGLNPNWITTPLNMPKTCTRGDGCHPSFSTSHAHPFDSNGNELALPNFSDINAPEGGLWTTAQDMATWIRYQLFGATGTGSAITRLNNALPRQRVQLPGGTGYSWRFSNVTGHGITHPVRWKLGRYQGFNSYIGISDDAHAGVFVFVNADPVDPAVDSPDNVLRTELAEPILGDFFLANP